MKNILKELKENNYEYFIINPRMDARYFSSKVRFGENATQELLPQRYDEIFNSQHLFTPVHQIDNSFIALKIN